MSTQEVVGWVVLGFVVVLMVGVTVLAIIQISAVING